MPYSFAYTVKDDPSYNNYGHSESSDGNVVTGQYFVHLPDGRIQTVTYRADEYGYVADVKYEGEASYPDYKPAYKPAYEPAYKPAYKPEYKPAYEPEYKPAYKPAYPKPSYPSYPKPAYPKYA